MVEAVKRVDDVKVCLIHNNQDKDKSSRKFVENVKIYCVGFYLHVQYLNVVLVCVLYVKKILHLRQKPVNHP